MKVIENERVIFCDVDETLITHDAANLGTRNASELAVFVKNPHTNENIVVYKNLPMIRCLIEEKARGGFIVVWSMGGNAWAKNVLTELELDDKVDLVMSKPFAYFDDKPVESWLKYRLFIEPKTLYKEKI